MNIRSAEATALTAVTDLFVAATPPRDDTGSDDFQRALQPPPQAVTQRQPEPPSQPEANHIDSNDGPTASAPTTPAEEPEATLPEEVVAAVDSPASAEETAEDEVQDPLADQVEQPENEPKEATEVVAESLAVAAAANAEQAVIPQQPADGELPASELHSTVVAPSEQSLPEAPAIAAEQLPAAATGLPVPQPQLGEAHSSPPTNTAAQVEQLPEEALKTGEAAISQTVAAIGVAPAAAPQAKISGEQAIGTSPAKKPQRDAAPAIAEVADGSIPITEFAAADTSPDPEVELSISKRRGESDKPHEEASQPNLQLTGPTNPDPITTPAPDPAAAATVSSRAAPDASANVQTGEAPPSSAANQSPAGHGPAQPVVAAIVNRLPGHALVRNVTTTSNESAPLHVDSARFLQRVARAFEAAREREGEIRLRLSPPELGALRVEVRMHEQGMVARVEVETADARSILLENLPALRERLAEQGLRLEKFDVDLAQRQPDQRGSHLPDQPQERQSQPEPRSVRSAPVRTSQLAAPQALAPAPTAVWQDRQLNVIV